MRQAANIVTSSRALAALVLIALPTFGSAFWVLYGWCGFSDMIDGTIARRSGSESRTGAILDSISDLIFVAVCLVKILPEISVPAWLWYWIGGIALIKIINIASGYICRHHLVMPHTVANKITGALLFILPVAIQWLPLDIPAAVVCTVASFAAITEGHLIRTGKYE